MVFLEEMGLHETGLARVIRAGYDLLHLITFFTVGPKEARAWTVEKGAKAPDAAGEIHTDIQRGFIRAETIAYDDYVALDGESRRARSRQAAPGRQGIRRPGRRRAPLQVQRLSSAPPFHKQEKRAFLMFRRKAGSRLSTFSLLAFSPQQQEPVPSPHGASPPLPLPSTYLPARVGRMPRRSGNGPRAVPRRIRVRGAKRLVSLASNATLSSPRSPPPPLPPPPPPPPLPPPLPPPPPRRRARRFARAPSPSPSPDRRHYRARSVRRSPPA